MLRGPQSGLGGVYNLNLKPEMKLQVAVRLAATTHWQKTSRRTVTATCSATASAEGSLRLGLGVSPQAQALAGKPAELSTAMRTVTAA